MLLACWLNKSNWHEDSLSPAWHLQHWTEGWHKVSALLTHRLTAGTCSGASIQSLIAENSILATWQRVESLGSAESCWIIRSDTLQPAQALPWPEPRTGFNTNRLLITFFLYSIIHLTNTPNRLRLIYLYTHANRAAVSSQTVEPPTICVCIQDVRRNQACWLFSRCKQIIKQGFTSEVSYVGTLVAV